MQPLSNSDTDATNRHSTISQTIQQPLSNPAPTIGNFNPSTRDAKEIAKPLAMVP